LKELETHLLLSTRAEILAVAAGKPLLDQTDEIGKMPRSPIRSRQREGVGE